MIADPVDPNQCMALLPVRHTAFSFGPPPKTQPRCTNVPKYVVNEIVKGEDGEYGAMSLCPDCKDVFMMQFMSKLGNFVFSEIIRLEKE